MKLMVMNAVKSGKPSNGEYFDATMVRDWIHELYNIKLTVKSVGRYLVNCPLPRKRLTKNEQRLWNIKFGRWTTIVYYQRQTGETAYSITENEHYLMRKNRKKAITREQNHIEQRRDELIHARMNGEYYDQDEYDLYVGEEL